VRRPALCASSLPVEKHRRGCVCAPGSNRLKLTVSESPLPYCEECPEVVTHLPLPDIPDLFKWFVHSSCVHNHINAVVGRVSICTPSPTQVGIQRLMQEARRFSSAFPTVIPTSYERVIESYDGYRRRRYEKAFSDLKAGSRVDPSVRMFIKQELLPFKEGKPNPECRAIQFRDPTFGLSFARYIKPYEHYLPRVKPRKFPTEFIAKTMTMSERAGVLRRKYDNLGCKLRGGERVYCMGLDGERFDAHVNSELLKVTHCVYNRIFRDKALRRLCTQQLRNRVRFRTRDGWGSYVVHGGRMSGDMDTSAGNTTIMCLMLNAFGLDTYGEGNYDFLDDGDDSVFMFIAKEPTTEELVTNYFLQFGLTMKLEFNTPNFLQINFCQSAPVLVNDRWLLVRDYRKVISKTLSNLKFKQPGMRPKLLKTIALGELSQCCGVPVLDPFFRKCVEIADKNMSKRGKRDGGLVKDLASIHFLLPKMLKQLSRAPIQITQESRTHFAGAFGISPSVQMDHENAITNWNLTLKQEAVLGEAIDREYWRYDWKMDETTACWSTGSPSLPPKTDTVLTQMPRDCTGGDRL